AGICHHPSQAAGNGLGAGPDVATDEPARRRESGRSNGFGEARLAYSHTWNFLCLLLSANPSYLLISSFKVKKT
ncbi:hypothetical protein XENORESO_000086, partial [Xenotaenia resolanae]